MKNKIGISLIICIMSVVCCSAQTGVVNEKIEGSMIPINITVGNKVFSAEFFDSEATRSLMAQFPMTVQMSDFSSQEKTYTLQNNLKGSSIRPDKIYEGDIMCWSGNTLVLFYKTFSNSYGGYIRIGKITNPSGLREALGTGSVQVIWSLAK